jgi:hypothetical protein
VATTVAVAGAEALLLQYKGLLSQDVFEYAAWLQAPPAAADYSSSSSRDEEVGTTDELVVSGEAEDVEGMGDGSSRQVSAEPDVSDSGMQPAPKPPSAAAAAATSPLPWPGDADVLVATPADLVLYLQQGPRSGLVLEGLELLVVEGEVPGAATRQALSQLVESGQPGLRLLVLQEVRMARRFL